MKIGLNKTRNAKYIFDYLFQTAEIKTIIVTSIKQRLFNYTRIIAFFFIIQKRELQLEAFTTQQPDYPATY